MNTYRLCVVRKREVFEHWAVICAGNVVSVHNVIHAATKRLSGFVITWMTSRNVAPIIMRSTNHVVSPLFKVDRIALNVSLSAEAFGIVAINVCVLSSNTIHYSTQRKLRCSDNFERAPYLAIRGNLWIVFCCFFGGKWPQDIGTKLSQSVTSYDLR